VIVLAPALNGMAGINQLEEPCATPVAPAAVVQLTCTLPEPPDAVPLNEMDADVVVLGGAMTAMTRGLVGAGSGDGAGAGALAAAAYKS